MAEPFFWGGAGQKLSPAQAAARRRIADQMLSSTTAATTLGGGLAKVGDALKGIYYDKQASEAEAAGASERKAVLDALMGNSDPSMVDLYGAMGNEWVSSDPASMAVIQAMMGQEMQQNDPLRQLQIQQAQQGLDKGNIELEQLRNPPPTVPEAPTLKTIFDEATGREQTVQWNGTDWEPIGGVQAPKDPLVQVNTGEGSTQWNKTLDENNAKRYIGFQDEAAAAQRALNSFAAMEQLLADPALYSGAGGEQVLGLKRLGAAMGLNPEGIDSMETFNALSKQSALDVMGGSLGTGFSNADRDFVIDQVANLGNTPQGNLRIIEIQKKLAQRKIEISQLAQEYVDKNGQLDNGFDRQLREWAEANPLFPKDEQAAPQSQANPEIYNGGVVDYTEFFK